MQKRLKKHWVSTSLALASMPKLHYCSILCLTRFMT